VKVIKRHGFAALSGEAIEWKMKSRFCRFLLCKKRRQGAIQAFSFAINFKLFKVKHWNQNFQKRKDQFGFGFE
jgi:hypothetical protein